MILSWNAKTSFSAILDNWEVPVCCWNTIGYSVCDLKRAEKTGPCWRKCIWKQFTENWFLPGSAFHKELVQYPWKSAPREEIMSTTWISKKLALPALTSKHCQCNLYQFSQYFSKSIRRCIDGLSNYNQVSALLCSLSKFTPRLDTGQSKHCNAIIIARFKFQLSCKSFPSDMRLCILF